MGLSPVVSPGHLTWNDNRIQPQQVSSVALFHSWSSWSSWSWTAGPTRGTLGEQPIQATHDLGVLAFCGLCSSRSIHEPFVRHTQQIFLYICSFRILRRTEVPTESVWLGLLHQHRTWGIFLRGGALTYTRFPEFQYFSCPFILSG